MSIVIVVSGPSHWEVNGLVAGGPLGSLVDSFTVSVHSPNCLQFACIQNAIWAVSMGLSVAINSGHIGLQCITACAECPAAVDSPIYILNNQSHNGYHQPIGCLASHTTDNITATSLRLCSSLGLLANLRKASQHLIYLASLLVEPININTWSHKHYSSAHISNTYVLYDEKQVYTSEFF